MKTGNGAARDGGPRFRSILLVCTVNMARSGMTKKLMVRELKNRGLDERVRVRSAGIAPYARDGALISLDTRMTLRDVGIHIGDEATSTDLKRHPELLEEAELVIAMTEQQTRELLEKFPPARALEVHTLRSFVGESGDIADPYEKGDEVFSACRVEIERLVPRVIDLLFEE